MENKNIFKPRARLMLLLGDQLIRDVGIAAFELVKNAYDADADRCNVTLNHINTPDASIIFEDNGTGMTHDIVTGVWLEPGTDYRKKQRDAGKRSEETGRLPLGEKGIGRFAVHKLGKKIRLITRAKDCDEVVVRIDWEKDFKDKTYLSEVPISVVERKAEYFTGEKTGTRIEISNLREAWTRGKVRRLQRSINSICSPFERFFPKRADTFVAHLKLEPDPDPPKSWLKGLLNTKDVLNLALFKGKGIIDGTEVIYDYEFAPLPEMKKKIEGRKLENQIEKIFGVNPGADDSTSTRASSKPLPIDLNKWEIGSIYFDFYIFDREPAILNLTAPKSTGLKQFLNANGGVRVYRDDVRVYDFGEPGNDWLDLGGRRVNIPVKRISNNQIIAAISLDAEKSTALIEKTNREGFIENDAYAALKTAVLFAIRQIEVERNIDKERIRKLYSRKKMKEPVLDEISILRDKLKKKNLLEEFESIINRIEHQFLDAREKLLSPAAAGLNLSVVIHEVEKIVSTIVKAVEENAQKNDMKRLIGNLSDMIDGITYLLRSSGKTRESSDVLIQQAIFNCNYRFRAHKIKVETSPKKQKINFIIKCNRRLVVNVLMNLLDNSIYWLKNKGLENKKIYIGVTDELEAGPAFIVADNGPGFRETDPPEFLMQPFISRKDDGMGLGLYIAGEVARLHDGRVLFPEQDDVSIPPDYTGAIVALQIPLERREVKNDE